MKDGIKAALETNTQVLTMDSSWSRSIIEIIGAQQQSSHAGGAAGPRLRIQMRANDLTVALETHLQAPATTADAEQFDAFWDSVLHCLRKFKPATHRLLLATEYWPRDKRYYPTEDTLNALIDYGAQEATLDRWETLTQKMAPCALAGLTYAMAGDSIDGLSVGFARLQEEPSANVKIEGRFVHDAEGNLVLIEKEPTRETSTTLLHLITNTNGGRALALDPDNPDRMIMQDADATAIGQYWYLHHMPLRYEQIKTPCLLVNYETGKIAQGKLNEDEAPLALLGTKQEDDVIWDHRNGNSNANFLMVYHYAGAARNLMQDGNRLRARHWGGGDLANMRWNLTKVSK